MVNTSPTTTGASGRTGQHNQTSSREAAIQAQQQQQARENARLNQPIQSGGQGRVGGPYGVQFISGNRNPSSESQGRPGVSDKYQSQAGGNLFDYNQRASDYAKSLVVNRGLDPNSKEFDSAFQSYLQANRLEQVSDTSSRADSGKPLNFSENYGYTSKVSPIIAQNFAKNPLEVNFDLNKTKPATQARESFRSQFSSDQGGVTTPQSKGKSFGWGVISNNQLVRNSTKEEQVKQSEAERAFINSKPSKEAQNFDTFFTNAQSRGSTINIYNAQGARVGSVKADNKGRQTLESLGDAQGVYFRESSSQSKYVRPTEFVDTISTLGSQGAKINIINSKNQVVGTISGPNAYRDYLTKFGKSNESLQAQPVFSTTREGKQTTLTLISNARTVGSNTVNVYVKSSKNSSPILVESLPLNEKAVGSALDKYAGNPRISFGSESKQITTPKETTLTPSSILALDLNYQSSKSSTGKYFSLEQQAGGFFQKLGAESKLPLIPKNETSNQFGFSLPNPSRTIGEFGSSFLNLAIIGPIKSTPPLIAGLGTSYYNFFRTGSTGGPSTKVESPKALANVLGASIFAPQTFMGEQATKNLEKTSSFIHTEIGGPLRQQGVKVPQPVEKPETFGTFAGNIVGLGLIASPAAKIIPLRVGGQEGTIAFPGIGKVKSVGPLSTSEPYVQGPKTVTITGAILGYGGPKSIMILGRSSEGKTFVMSRLKPEFNPKTGKENLHLETYHATAERGSPFPESTKLTLSKIATTKGQEVFSQIKNEQGLPKFSTSEFGLELKAREANKYYGKIPNQKVSEKAANEIIKNTSITPSPEINVQVKQIAQNLQSRSKSTKAAFSELAVGNVGLSSSFGTFAISPLAPIKGSPIVVGQISEFNKAEASTALIQQPPISSVKDIDIELTRERQSQSLLNILNAKVSRPSGFEFTKEGTNIYYGKTGERGTEVFNLLSDKDINQSDISTTSGQGVFGKSYPTKTSRLGKLKTKTIGYQAQALTNSLSATHNVELIEQTKSTTEPKLYSGIKARLGTSEHIVTAFTPRVKKDLSRNVAVLEYGAKKTGGKASKAFTEYKNALIEKHGYVTLENISPNELAKQIELTKISTKNEPLSSSLISPKGSLFTNYTTSNSLLGSTKSQKYGLESSQTSSLSSKSNITSISSRSSKSAKSKSAKSLTSLGSFFSRSNLVSNKSTISNFSSKSAKSTKSANSLLSQSQPKSSRSTGSSASSKPSNFSSISSKSNYSVLSTISPFSTTTNFFSPTSRITKTPKIPLIGNIGITRKSKTREGPTALFKLNVVNIFASGFNIEESGKNRYAF